MTHSTGQVFLLRWVGTGDLSVPEGRIIIIIIIIKTTLIASMSHVLCRTEQY